MVQVVVGVATQSLLMILFVANVVIAVEQLSLVEPDWLGRGHFLYQSKPVFVAMKLEVVD